MAEEKLVDKSIFQIDENRLLWEWCRQADLFFKYGLKLAKYRSEMEHAKIKMELEFATLDNEIRTNPERFGVDKITDKSVAAAILREDRYTTAQKDYLELKYLVDVLDQAVKALDHKRSGLQGSVRLLDLDYHAKPYASGDVKDVLDMAERKEDFRAIMPKRPPAPAEDQ